MAKVVVNLICIGIPVSRGVFRLNSLVISEQTFKKMKSSFNSTCLFLFSGFFIVSVISSCGLVETKSVNTYQASVMFIDVPDTVQAGETADVTIYGQKFGDELHRLERSSDSESTTFIVIMEGEEPDWSLFWCGTPPNPVLAKTDVSPTKTGTYRIRVFQPDDSVMERVMVVK